MVETLLYELIKPYELARTRACMGPKELQAAEIPRGTLYSALNADVRPETVGRIAKALGVDVTGTLAKYL
ncbi:MAG TPA: hypothetical protein DCR27_09810 [Lachnospiraceae bacterium]|nr:hypothetical protein [Lachnospiraceae bacterium]